MREQCGFMSQPLQENTLSTVAEVAGVQNMLQTSKKQLTNFFSLLTMPPQGQTQGLSYKEQHRDQYLGGKDQHKDKD